MLKPTGLLRTDVAQTSAPVVCCIPEVLRGMTIARAQRGPNAGENEAPASRKEPKVQM